MQKPLAVKPSTPAPPLTRARLDASTRSPVQARTGCPDPGSASEILAKLSHLLTCWRTAQLMSLLPLSEAQGGFRPAPLLVARGALLLGPVTRLTFPEKSALEEGRACPCTRGASTASQTPSCVTLVPPAARPKSRSLPSVRGCSALPPPAPHFHWTPAHLCSHPGRLWGGAGALHQPEGRDHLHCHSCGPSNPTSTTLPR